MKYDHAVAPCVGQTLSKCALDTKIACVHNDNKKLDMCGSLTLYR